MGSLSEHPGLYFVVATLLPLASFLVLLVAGGVKQYFRSIRNTPTGGRLFEAVGGDQPSRVPAFVATGAIGLAFVLCLIGGVQFFREEADVLKAHEEHEKAEASKPHSHSHDHAHGGHDHKHEKNEAKEEVHGEEHSFEKRWSGRVAFAELKPDAVSPARVSAAIARKNEDPKSETKADDKAKGDEHAKGEAHDEHAAEGPPATKLYVGYRIDALSVIMFLMVTFIATLIHIFSMGYMSDELNPQVEDHQVHTDHGHFHRRGRFGRFFLFLSFFCFSMLNLILADNLFQVFVSWELVGICSYLLIGFYYERQSASNAANKAFITNRVGDAGFVIGLLVIWTWIGTFNFEEIFAQVRSPHRDAHGPVARAGQVVRADQIREENGVRVMEVKPAGTGEYAILFPQKLVLDHDQEEHFDGLETGKKARIHADPKPNQFRVIPYWLLVVAGLGIFTGCVGKSAQFPLHVWLPDAMEGPTPVSALIHAATMVAAGVYLVGRCFPIFVPESRLVIAYTGGITLFMAATIAIVMTDIKKVLAYSTVSQLGYMMLALGVGGWVAGIFHLLTHAFFKALLFLCSGAVIYNCHHEQDMSKMGGLFPKMKVTAITMLVGVLTIAGIPLFSGWYSKDAILAQALGFVYIHPQHSLLFILPLVTAGITAFYMFRMWFLTFTGEPRDHHVYEHAKESPRLMTVPLSLLAVMSIVVAWGWPMESTNRGIVTLAALIVGVIATVAIGRWGASRGLTWEAILPIAVPVCVFIGFLCLQMPVFDAEASHLGERLHHQMLHGSHSSVLADFGALDDEGWKGDNRPIDQHERLKAYEFHSLAEGLALGAGLLGILFAVLLYYARVMDPAETKEQLPALYRFLERKWYFDELYSVILVRPAMVVARWCRSFDLSVIDGFLNGTARTTVKVSRGEGWFDNGVIDGLVNLVGNVTYAVGSRLRGVQTGYLRSYVLFLVLAVVAIFALVSYFVRMAIAG